MHLKIKNFSKPILMRFNEVCQEIGRGGRVLPNNALQAVCGGKNGCFNGIARYNIQRFVQQFVFTEI